MEKTHGYINLYTSYVCDNRIATCKKNNGDTEVKVLHDNLEDELRTENRIKYINYNIDYICNTIEDNNSYYDKKTSYSVREELRGLTYFFKYFNILLKDEEEKLNNIKNNKSFKKKYIDNQIYNINYSDDIKELNNDASLALDTGFNRKKYLKLLNKNKLEKKLDKNYNQEEIIKINTLLKK